PCYGTRWLTVTHSMLRLAIAHRRHLRGFRTYKRCDATHGDARWAAGFELGEALVRHLREACDSNVVIRHAARAREHQIHGTGVDAFRRGRADPLAVVT